MSSALYNTMLMWNGHFGMAKHRGTTCDLKHWPLAALSGAHVSELRYIPEIRDCEVREMSGSWRSLERDEMAALLRWLNGLADAADSYINP